MKSHYKEPFFPPKDFHWESEARVFLKDMLAVSAHTSMKQGCQYCPNVDSSSQGAINTFLETKVMNYHKHCGCICIISCLFLLTVSFQNFDSDMV